jgi:pimeloyl-ACP methyl ester carboxylesterase
MGSFSHAGDRALIPDLDRIAARRGVVLRARGVGVPVIVFPGMEGSGESCLHLVLPVLEALGGAGSYRLVLVDYGEEQHGSLDGLAETVAELLAATLGPEPPAVFWGQSFGNLLAVRVASLGTVDVARYVLVSPFSGLPRAKAWLGTRVLQRSPVWLYRATAKPFGRWQFGPTGGQRHHPFFTALQRSSPRLLSRRISWLDGRRYTRDFEELDRPSGFWLGRRDRLVDLRAEKRLFHALAQRPGNSLSLLAGSGHVVLPPAAVATIQRQVTDWLLAG